MKNVIVPLLAAWFVLLHNPDGDEIYVNAEQIDFIGHPARGEAPTNACNRVMVYGVYIWVWECPKIIKEAIDVVLKQN
jgi:hypothetical protein